MIQSQDEQTKMIPRTQSSFAHERIQKKRMFRNKSIANQQSKMYSISKSVALSILLLLLCSSQSVKAAGVFEFELYDLQTNLDEDPSRLSNINDTANIRLLICLKEAFTSHLYEPCTFGSSSLTLGRKPQRPIAEQQQQFKQQLQSEQESLYSTNTVRIPFTFRWTKSFTLIVTAEQIDTPNGEHRTITAQPISSGKPVVPLPRIAATFTSDNDGHPISATGGSTASINRSASIEQASIGGAVVDDGPNGAAISGAINRLPSVQPTISQPAKQLQAGPLTHLVDRHILTENEVVPNLDTNNIKRWSSRFSRTLKSSLAYRFRVYCSLNYYGDGCTTFCRPRDDQFGHYNCSSTGQKICLNGWQGSDCDRAVCRPGCNQQHGYCDKPDTCQCRPGWTGTRCDECLTYPGCQHGYCLSPWECKCQRNWGGWLCDLDLNYCGTHDPCKNNGTCSNVAPGRYKCHCPNGFAGVDCGTNLSSVIGSSMIQLSAGCMLNPCLNGGTCFGFSSRLVDSTGAAPHALGAGQFGPSDGMEMAADHTLQLHEDLIDSPISDTNPVSTTIDRLYRCQCPPGWSGDYCQWPDSTGEAITIISGNSSANDYGTATSVSMRNISGTKNALQPYGDENNLTNPLNESNKDEVEHLHMALMELANKTDDTKSDLNAMRSTAPRSQDETYDNVPAMIEVNSKIGGHITNMHQLISWVVVASTIGVLIAFLTLSWCCLVAVERNKLPFIQMNIIRSPSDNHNQPTTVVVTTTLRRMQEKIRNSFRRTTSRQHIKPETKLSIENVFRQPTTTSALPPSYEESKSNYLDHIGVTEHYTSISKGAKYRPDEIVNDESYSIENHDDATEMRSSDNTRYSLVKKGALESKLASKLSAQKSVVSMADHQDYGDSTRPERVDKSTQSPKEVLYSGTNQEKPITANNQDLDIDKSVTIAKLQCPKHGYMHRYNNRLLQEHYQHQHQHYHHQHDDDDIEQLCHAIQPHQQYQQADNANVTSVDSDDDADDGASSNADSNQDRDVVVPITTTQLNIQNLQYSMYHSHHLRTNRSEESRGFKHYSPSTQFR